MLRSWLKKFGNGRRALASSFSLSLLFLVVFARGQDYGRWQRELEAAPTPAAKEALIERWSIESPNAFHPHDGLEDNLAIVADRAIAQRLSEVPPGDLAAEARKIRASNPFYRERTDREGSNWVRRAGESIGETIRRMLDGLRPQTPQGQMPQMQVPALGFLTYFLWGILAVAILVALVLLIKQIRIRNERRALVKASTGLLDEDEPDRTMDEWLRLADQLEAEGRYREAVRALYLACLLRFDEAGVARFNRRQTNWEHLARIEVAPNRPTEIAFREPTKAFDRIWYGNQVQGLIDVERFRTVYTQLKQALPGRSQ